MELSLNKIGKTSEEDLGEILRVGCRTKVRFRFLLVIQVRVLSRLLDKCLEFRNIQTKDINLGVINKSLDLKI